MKSFSLSAAALIAVLGVSVSAQPATPATPAQPQAASAQPAKGIKITKVTGTVNIMKDGVVVMTLKPGDAIPEITDNKVTFAVVDGTVEVEAGGKKVSAATGSNFTVASTNGQTNVAIGAGTPVAVRTESGNNLIMTANSEVKMVNTNGKVQISMEKGNAVMTNASGGETQTVTAGQAVFVPSAPMTMTPEPQAKPEPVEAAKPEPVEAAEPIEAPVMIPVVETPPTTVIPTQTVEQSCEVSASSPDCN